MYQYSSHSAYPKILACFEKRTSVKTSDFSDGPCKILIESRALPFESGVHTKLVTNLKTPCTSHNSFDMVPFRLSHTQRHTVDQVLNMHYTKRNCRHVTHPDSLQRTSDENCMQGQMGEQLDHGQQLEHQQRKQNILVAGLLCGCS